MLLPFDVVFVAVVVIPISCCFLIKTLSRHDFLRIVIICHKKIILSSLLVATTERQNTGITEWSDLVAELPRGGGWVSLTSCVQLQGSVKDP